MTEAGTVDRRPAPVPILLRGVASGAVLVAVMLVAPWLLVHLGHLPDPRGWSRAGMVTLLTTPDDGHVLLVALTVVAWVAWLVFAVAVITEVAGAVVSARTGRRIRIRLPGLHAPQLVAATLVLAVVAMLAGSAQAAATPNRGDQPTQPRHGHAGAEPGNRTEPPPAHATPTTSSTSPASVPASTTPASTTPTSTTTGAPRAPDIHYTVRPGDDLWSLAEHFYQDGTEWRTIAAANQDLLTGGPDELIAGWRLRIPHPVHVRPASVVVHAGDTLTTLAERYYHDPEQWRAIAVANRGLVDDPDLIRPGWRLTLPDAHTEGTASLPPQAKTGADQPAAPPTTPHPADPPVSGSPGPTDSARPTQSPTPTDIPRRTTAPTPDPGPAGTRTPPAAPVAEPAVGLAPGNAAGVAALGGLLGATLVGGLAARRQRQLLQRPVGRRIPHPGPVAQRLESQLAAALDAGPAGAMTADDLDLALRGVALRTVLNGPPPPTLRWATMHVDRIVIRLGDVPGPAPLGFGSTEGGWQIDRAGLDYLRTVPGIATAPRLWPALCCLGDDHYGSRVLVNLEHAGLVGVDVAGGPARLDSRRAIDAVATGDGARGSVVAPTGETGDWGAGQETAWGQIVAGLVLGLALAPWAGSVRICVVGCPGEEPPDWLEAAAAHNLTWSTDPDYALRKLAAVVDGQAGVAPSGDPPDDLRGDPASLAARRLDATAAEAWDPQLLVFTHRPAKEHSRRLREIFPSETPSAVAVIAPAVRPTPTWALAIGAGDSASARLEPIGVDLVPVRVRPELHDPVVDLIATTGRADTLPAPWWHGGGEHAAYVPRHAMPQPDGLDKAARDIERLPDTDDADAEDPVADDLAAAWPEVRLLGPIDLAGAGGPPPSRARRQCVEYCAWLLEHPGATASAMADALCVAETTRRSNMSRLRGWLGDSDDGRPYLPDAYSGRIALDPMVSSDWHRLQLLITTGIDRSRTQDLERALRLVRGAPLADAAPGQWHWAEELRTDMVSTVRDIGVELARRATRAGDLDLARWAAAHALVAAPDDELLMSERIRTEHHAGRPVEVERLVRQVQGRARALETDLHEETIVLMQIALEGRPRVRRL